MDQFLSLKLMMRKKLKAWKRHNTILMSWMVHYVSVEIKSALLYVHDAKERWLKLMLSYALPDDVRIFELQQELDTVTKRKQFCY